LPSFATLFSPNTPQDRAAEFPFFFTSFRFYDKMKNIQQVTGVTAGSTTEKS